MDETEMDKTEMDKTEMDKTEILVGLLKEQNTVVAREELDYPRVTKLDIEDPIHGRTVRVLDAFAHALVSRPFGEVVAVGLQLFGDRVILTIASNESVDKKTVEQAHTIWKHLQLISEQYHEVQRSHFKPEELAYYKRPASTFPKMITRELPDRLKSSIEDFQRCMYAFSIKKLRQRLEKPFGQETRLAAFIRIAQSPPESTPEQVRPVLQNVAYPLGYISRTFSEVKDITSDEGEFEDFILALQSIQQDVNEVLRDKELSRYLDVAGAMSEFPLVGYLKKIVSLPNAFDQLLACAYSPRLRYRFLCGKKLEVIPLNNPVRQFKLPPVRTWTDIAEGALGRVNQSLNPGDDPGISIRKQYGNMSLRAGVHCECLLALHFLDRFYEEKTPPLGYLGVSKLSCLCCWEFLKTLREHGGHFYTKGTHSKTYFPWIIPVTELERSSLPADKIRRSFHLKLEANYVKAVLHSRRRSKSASSAEGPVEKIGEENLMARFMAKELRR